MATRVRAKFSYDPQIEDELRLTKGDVITVVEKSNDGWWKGELNGETGWFPGTYVEVIDETNNNNEIMAKPQVSYKEENTTYSIKNAAPVIATPIKNTRPALEMVTGLYKFDATMAEELSFEKGEELDIIEYQEHDPQWLVARNARGETGLVPTNYIESKGNKKATGEPWNFGPIGRNKAETVLSRAKEGEYLVRDSETNPGDFSISVRGNGNTKHFKVLNQNGKLVIGNLNFSDMDTLLQHYTHSPIFSSKEETIYLRNPLEKFHL